MDLAVLSPQSLPLALSALREVVASNGTVTPAESRFLEVIAELHGSSVDVGALRDVELAEIARAITDPHQRKRVVQLALIAAMVEGDVTDAESAAVRRLASALDVDERGLKVLQELAGNHRLLTRMDMTRRIFGKFGGKALQEEGFAGLRKMMAPVLGTEDVELAWKYKQLGLLPEGSLGRGFWVHCAANKFAMPGEKGGIPERMVFHDFGHVLAGYATDPAGEIQQGAFQAGFVREDGFAFLMFVVIQFHLGIKVTPVADGEVGLFDVAKVMRAAARGSACKVDLSDRWDPFAVAHLPLVQVREQYGIPPV